MHLTRKTVNGFRYQVAVQMEGQSVLAEVVKWTYKGKDLGVKSFLLSEGYSNKTCKDIFTRDQRQILNRDSGATFESYDISLLFIILKHCCGLAKPSAVEWSSGRGIESLICQLKNERNVISHTHRIDEISDEELVRKLKQLQNLLAEILYKACILCGKPENLVCEKVSKMESEFQQLLSKLREPLDSSDLDLFPQLQEEIDVFHTIIVEKVVNDSREELYERYPKLWSVCLARWLWPDLRVRPRLNFSKLIIMEDVTWDLPSCQEARYIPHGDLLQVKRRDGSLPEVLVISGDGGIGKSTLLKFLIETWVTNPSQIKGLKELTHLLFFQLRGSTISNWNDLLKNIFPETFRNSRLSTEFFVDLFLNLPIVLLLDGYDEANEASKKLITDLINIKSKMRIVITTRPACLKELIYTLRSKRLVMSVEIRGMEWEDCCHYVNNTVDDIMENLRHVNTVDDIVENARRGEAMKNNILRHLKNMVEENHLNVPLTMKLLTVREYLAPEKDPQDIYEDLTVLMMGKTEERLTLQHIADAEDKIKQYYEFQKEIALRGLKRREHDLLPETVDELKKKCRDLELPDNETLSGFLTSKTKLHNFKVVQAWSYPHVLFQEHWAASCVAKQMSHFAKLLKAKVAPEENPLFRIYFDGSAEAETLLREDGCSQKQLMVDVLCRAIAILPSLDETLMNELVKGVIDIFCSDDHSYISTERGCSAICKLIRASGLLPSVVETCAQRLRGHDTWEVQARFLKEIVALTVYAPPKQVVLLPLKEVPEEGQTEEQKEALEALAQRNIDVETQHSSVFGVNS